MADNTWTQPTMTATETALQASTEDVWYLKDVEFNGRRTKVITQNFNGPCSFIAICNILLLRGDITIQPANRSSVSYEFLSQLLGEYLLTHASDVDISAALSMMPLTTRGMNLNPLFVGYKEFRPSRLGGELQLFEQTGIELVHGWLVDPASAEYSAVAKTQDYDSSMDLIAEADHLTHGQLFSSSNEPAAGSSSSGAGASLMGEQSVKVQDALSVRNYLDTTSSQLTYHGLFTLASTLKPGSLVALFRNSHLSVLYKPHTTAPTTTASATEPAPALPIPEVNPAPTMPVPETVPVAAPVMPVPQPTNPFLAMTPQPTESQPTNPFLPPQPDAPPPTNPFLSMPAPSIPGPSTTPSSQGQPATAAPVDGNSATTSSLFTLVTDFSFLHEPTVVWERLDDVDGGASAFVDSDFRPSAPAGGDFAGETAESALRAMEADFAAAAIVDPLDHELARQLQAEEDAQAHVYERQHAERRAAQQERPRREERQRVGAPRMKKKTSCLIM